LNIHEISCPKRKRIENRGVFTEVLALEAEVRTEITLHNKNMVT